jgi:hypothetical protein
MAKQIFEVTKKEIMYQYLYVEAESAEAAEAIANELDGDCWRDSQHYECEIDRVEIADPKETKGCYIETAEGSYQLKEP